MHIQPNAQKRHRMIGALAVSARFLMSKPQSKGEISMVTQMVQLVVTTLVTATVTVTATLFVTDFFDDVGEPEIAAHINAVMLRQYIQTGEWDVKIFINITNLEDKPTFIEIKDLSVNLPSVEKRTAVMKIGRSLHIAPIDLSQGPINTRLTNCAVLTDLGLSGNPGFIHGEGRKVEDT